MVSIKIYKDKRKKYFSHSNVMVFFNSLPFKEFVRNIDLVIEDIDEATIEGINREIEHLEVTYDDLVESKVGIIKNNLKKTINLLFDTCNSEWVDNEAEVLGISKKQANRIVEASKIIANYLDDLSFDSPIVISDVNFNHKNDLKLNEMLRWDFDKYFSKVISSYNLKKWAGRQKRDSDKTLYIFDNETVEYLSNLYKTHKARNYSSFTDYLKGYAASHKVYFILSLSNRRALPSGFIPTEDSYLNVGGKFVSCSEALIKDTSLIGAYPATNFKQYFYNKLPVALVFSGKREMDNFIIALDFVKKEDEFDIRSLIPIFASNRRSFNIQARRIYSRDTLFLYVKSNYIKSKIEPDGIRVFVNDKDSESETIRILNFVNNWIEKVLKRKDFKSMTKKEMVEIFENRLMELNENEELNKDNRNFESKVVKKKLIDEVSVKAKKVTQKDDNGATKKPAVVKWYEAEKPSKDDVREIVEYFSIDKLKNTCNQLRITYRPSYKKDKLVDLLVESGLIISYLSENGYFKK